jgi:spermidine/putrescine transport system ATP-binding protein
VASFLGASNLMSARVVDANQGQLALGGGTSLWIAPDRVPAGATTISVGVRPEKLHLNEPTAPIHPPNRLDGTVTDASFTGVSTQYLVNTTEIGEVSVMAQNFGERHFRLSDHVAVGWYPEHTFVVSG